MNLNISETKNIVQEAIIVALFHLMCEKDYHKIKITEIVKRAGVSRTAFYNHFKSKEEVFDGLINMHIYNCVKRFVEPNVDLYNIFLDIFELIKNNTKLADRILKVSVPREKIIGNFSIIDLIAFDRSKEEKYRLKAIEGSISAIALDWYVNGMQESSMEMARICANITQRLI